MFAAVGCLIMVAGCGGASDDDSAQGQITVPPAEQTTAPNDVTPTTEVQGTVALSQSWFGQPADAAITAIEDQGIFVADFRVCSGSVNEGEVRQITTGDGVILDDKDGLTDDAQEIAVGSVVQMKVGTGTPCD